MPRPIPKSSRTPSSGNGTLSHLGMEVFKQRAGISILHVPYRGSVPAMTDLMTGIVGVAMDTVAVTDPLIRADKLRPIASAYGKRVAAFPDIPTVAEQGFPEVDLSAWLGIVVSAATPPNAGRAARRRYQQDHPVARHRGEIRSTSAPFRVRSDRRNSATFWRKKTPAGAPSSGLPACGSNKAAAGISSATF